MADRRQFLEFLAASPLLAGIPAFAFAQPDTARVVGGLIDAASNALDVFDLEAVARRNVSIAHWGYMASGVDGEETIKANRDAYAHYQLRTRRLVDVSSMDLSVDLFGAKFDSPVFICPIGGNRAYHPLGELAVAKAARAKRQLQILSTATSTAVEDVIAARGAPVWYQLYTTSNFDIAAKLVKRAEIAGCPVVVVTVDLPAGRNTETATRAARADTRACTSCHGPTGPELSSRPMFSGIDMIGVLMNSPALTWDFIRRLKDSTKMKVVIKGLESSEDAALAVRHGVDGVIVSNHGGRATETGRGTLESLPGIVAAVHGRIPVLVDGGVRRGTDILKALALGATAVGIGRPYIWGLGAFGQPGVERVLDLLNIELKLAMAGVGARTVREITPASVIGKS